MSNKDEMTSKDLQYMNKVFEQMKLDHEKLLTEYYNYKKPDLRLTGIDINLYYKLLSLTKMKDINLNLSPDKAGALWLALDNTIHLGTDFRDRFTEKQRQDVLELFEQVKQYNPFWQERSCVK